MKNSALKKQGSLQGTFKLQSIVNGRPSWSSESHAIWYIPKDKDWAIGNLGNIGATMKGITAAGNDPQHITSWKYYNGDEWMSPDEKNDIIVECIDGM